MRRTFGFLHREVFVGNSLKSSLLKTVELAKVTNYPCQILAYQSKVMFENFQKMGNYMIMQENEIHSVANQTGYNTIVNTVASEFTQHLTNQQNASERVCRYYVEINIEFN